MICRNAARLRFFRGLSHGLCVPSNCQVLSKLTFSSINNNRCQSQSAMSYGTAFQDCLRWESSLRGQQSIDQSSKAILSCTALNQQWRSFVASALSLNEAGTFKDGELEGGDVQAALEEAIVEAYRLLESDKVEQAELLVTDGYLLTFMLSVARSRSSLYSSFQSWFQSF